jgi:hypothetical protein
MLIVHTESPYFVCSEGYTGINTHSVFSVEKRILPKTLTATCKFAILVVMMTDIITNMVALDGRNVNK